jgi:hypothetical protein
MTRTFLGSLALACAFVACSSDSQPQKGTTLRGSDAQDSGQAVGGTTRSNQRYAANYGSYYEGVYCDYTDEGLAWCDDDYTIVYCDAGEWWALDCSEVGGYYCGDDGYTVDCY